MRILVIAAGAMALASCGPQDNDPGPGGVTIGEARALDEAAEMIEQNRPPAELLTPPTDKAAVQPEAAAD